METELIAGQGVTDKIKANGWRVLEHCTRTVVMAVGSKIIKGSRLKVYKGAPHGMASTLKDQINAGLLEASAVEETIANRVFQTGRAWRRVRRFGHC